MQAREALMKSEIFGDDLKKLLPVIEPENRILPRSTMYLSSST
jgi:glutamate synthase domain-containing protein 1